MLIIGGADNAGKTTGTTIVYDPATGSFTNGPTMDKARERHTATLVTSGPNAGKVLVVGGRVKNGNNYSTHATYQFCDADVVHGSPRAASPDAIRMRRSSSSSRPATRTCW